MVLEQFLTLGFWSHIVISSIIGAIAIYLAVKITKEVPSIIKAFLVAIVANVIAFLGIMGIVSAFLPIPYALEIVSIIIWILLVKFFFKMGLIHAIMVGVIAFVISYVISIFI